MEKQLKSLLKSLKINENLISTIMGGVVVVVMAAMIFNYFKTFNKSGQITDEAAVNLSEEEVLSKELPTTYKVVKGDDLWHISERFYNSGYNYVDIVSENKLKDGNKIEVGMTLAIPKVEPRLTAKMKAERAAKQEKVVTEEKLAKAVVKTAKISIEGGKYTIVKGDYLWSIAVRAYGDGYKWTAIYNANKAKIGNNPNWIFSGVELVLPR